MENTTENTWILGVEAGKDFLKISFLNEARDEIISENYILEDSWQPEDIAEKLEEFLEEKKYITDHRTKIIFSGEEAVRDKINQAEQRLFHCGYEKEDIRFISQENAFIHYILNQEEEIRRYTVLLFDFDGQEMFCYRLGHSRKKQPEQYKAEKKLIGSFSISGDRHPNGKLFDDTFARAARQILSKEVVGAVYLTGNGFEGGWLDKSLRVLCDGRRAFMGQNLFSSGCYYYGKAMMSGALSGMLIQAPETVLYDAGVLDGSQGDTFVPMIESGCAWYDAKGELDIILERAGKVDVVFINSLNQEKQVETVDVSGLSARPKKTGRLQLQIEFFSSNTGAIFVRDKGFGAFYPATNQVFFKKFTLL